MMKLIPPAAKRILGMLKEKSPRYSTAPAFVRNSLFQKWGMAVCLSLILSLLLIPRIHFSHPDYKLGMIAREHVKADRDFLVEDRLSTDQKRMEALSEMSAVYDFDSGLHAKREAVLIHAFLNMEETMQRIKTSSAGLPTAVRTQALAQAHKDFEIMLGVSITKEEFETLLRYQFSRAVAQKISGLLSGVMRSEWITNVTFLKQDFEKGILVRDTQTLKETQTGNLSAIRHLNQVDTPLLKMASPVMAGEKANLRRAGISLAKKMIQPNLTFNRDATEQRRQDVLAAVKPVYFQVQANEMIIREGEKISRADLDKIEAYYKINEAQRLSNILNFSGLFLTILFLAVLLYLLSAQWLRKSRNVQVEIFFLGVMAVFQVLLVKAGIFISEAINRAFPFIPAEACFFAVPFAVGAMLVGIMINRNVAFIFAIFSSVMVSFLFEARFTMMLFSLLGGMTACYHIVHCRKRSAFFKTGFFLGLVNVIVIIALTLIAGQAPAAFQTLIKMAMGFFGGIQAGIIVAGITPLVESLFKYTTDIKLLELGNLNQPIFQKMIIESPGTYHHSIIVGSMVEAAAEAIGANSLLAKVSAYYHDIGKVKKPHYYIENQRNGENRHDKLSPRMSALVIISHIKDGCDLAAQVKLGREISNIIREHHGTSLVRYFYEKAKKGRDASIRTISESDFRYPGPKPQTREAGLVLLGDVIEASSRTLTNPTPSRIRNLVRERIERVFMDGQLDECELTLRDLNSISETFTRILNGIFHQRIDYPLPNIREFKINGVNNHNHDYPSRKQAENGKN